MTEYEASKVVELINGMIPEEKDLAFNELLKWKRTQGEIKENDLINKSMVLEKLSSVLENHVGDKGSLIFEMFIDILKREPVVYNMDEIIKQFKQKSDLAKANWYKSGEAAAFGEHMAYEDGLEMLRKG